MVSSVASSGELAAVLASAGPSTPPALFGVEVLEGLPIVALSVLAVCGSVLALCALTMSGSFPELPRWPSRRQRIRVEATYERSTQRGSVTGTRPTLNDAPRLEAPTLQRRTVTGPPRQVPRGPDVLNRDVNVVAAERTIEHLLETDPDAFAGIIMQWLEEDQQAEASHAEKGGRR